MADTKISGLPASTTPLAGTEELPIVQSGVTRKVSVANLTAGRAINATEVTLTTGNLVIGTSGKGVDFSATPGTGTSELLDDYEEGTFTPTLVTLGAPFTSVTYNADIFGRYTKVGKVITIQLYMRTDAITLGGASSVIAIGGLPFASGDKNGVGAVSGNYDWNTGPSGAVVFGGGDTRIGLQSRASLNGNMDYLTVANVLTGFGANQVFVTATYRTA